MDWEKYPITMCALYNYIRKAKLYMENSAVGVHRPHSLLDYFGQIAYSLPCREVNLTGKFSSSDDKQRPWERVETNGILYC